MRISPSIFGTWWGSAADETAAGISETPTRPSVTKRRFKTWLPSRGIHFEKSRNCSLSDDQSSGFLHREKAEASRCRNLRMDPGFVAWWRRVPQLRGLRISHPGTQRTISAEEEAKRFDPMRGFSLDREVEIFDFAATRIRSRTQTCLPLARRHLPLLYLRHILSLRF